MKKVTLLTAIVFVLSIAALGVCMDYYVDAVNGSERNSGTAPDDAWKTITHSLSLVDGTAEETAIIHVAAGIYNLSLGEVYPIELKSNVSLEGTDMDATILDATESKTSVVQIQYVENVLVENLTITGGEGSTHVYMDIEYCYGGGLLISASEALIKNCRISENTAYTGGGIYGNSPMTEVVDCMISDNRAYDGGGVYFSELSLKGCIIENNIVEQKSDYNYGFGGGIYSYLSNYSPPIENCIIRNNSAHRGGGAYFEFSSTEMNNCVIEDNSSVDNCIMVHSHLC